MNQENRKRHTAPEFRRCAMGKHCLDGGRLGAGGTSRGCAGRRQCRRREWSDPQEPKHRGLVPRAGFGKLGARKRVGERSGAAAERVREGVGGDAGET